MDVAAVADVTGSVRVIVVDDDPLVRAAIAMILGRAPGVEVVGEAADGAEVLTAVDKYAPDVVLMDIRMPRLDGFGVLKKMRQEERTRFVPVVMLTSSDHPEDVGRAYEMGANGYLDKFSDEVRWDEMVRAAVRYWVRMNITPYSLVGQDNGFSRGV